MNIASKAATLEKILKLIPGIDEKLDRVLSAVGDTEQGPGNETLADLANKDELGLSLTYDQIQRAGLQLLELIRKHPVQLARLDMVRRELAVARFERMAHNLKIISKHESEEVHYRIAHNLDELENSRFVVVERPSRLLFPLLSIDRIYLNRANLKVLIIGPRTEMELIQYVSYGFEPKNIRSLDLFSYSPTIEVGDMHAMPYADGEFDIVVAAWVISYSTENKIAAKEIMRVCKPGGFIGISLDYKSPLRWTEENGEKVEICTENTQQLMSIFGRNPGKVYFANDPDPAYPPCPEREPSANILVFQKA